MINLSECIELTNAVTGKKVYLTPQAVQRIQTVEKHPKERYHSVVIGLDRPGGNPLVITENPTSALWLLAGAPGATFDPNRPKRYFSTESANDPDNPQKTHRDCVIAMWPSNEDVSSGTEAADGAPNAGMLI